MRALSASPSRSVAAAAMGLEHASFLEVNGSSLRGTAAMQAAPIDGG